jgi:CD109 antigen
VDIQVTPDSVEPGKAVDIVVKAKPNSYVGVLGVDQSVLLLKTGNDISRVNFVFFFLNLNFVWSNENFI